LNSFFSLQGAHATINVTTGILRARTLRIFMQTGAPARIGGRTHRTAVIQCVTSYSLVLNQRSQVYQETLQVSGCCGKDRSKSYRRRSISLKSAVKGVQPCSGGYRHCFQVGGPNRRLWITPRHGPSFTLRERRHGELFVDFFLQVRLLASFSESAAAKLGLMPQAILRSGK
jgi:hypothetical protein